MHPPHARVTRGVGAAVFVTRFTLAQNRWKIDDGLGVARVLVGDLAVYGAINALAPLRLAQEQEFVGADLSIHRIGATPEREASGRRRCMRRRRPTTPPETQSTAR